MRCLRPSGYGRAEIRCGGLAQRQARGRVGSCFAGWHGYSYFDDVARTLFVVLSALSLWSQQRFRRARASSDLARGGGTARKTTPAPAVATISHCSAQKAGARPWPPLKSSMSITVVHDAPTRGLFVCGFLSIVSTLLTDPCGGPRVCSVPVPKSQAHATTKSASSPARMALDVLDWITRRRRIATVHSPLAGSLGLYEA